MQTKTYFNENVKEAIKYLVKFLLRDNVFLEANVHYVDEEMAKTEAQKACCQLYIVQSGFFNKGIYGTEESMPLLMNGETIKLLYGKLKEIEIGTNLVIYEDVIASAYFCLSRYEQFLFPDDRNQYTRFRPEHSFLVKNKLIDVPIVDEYTEFLYSKLKQLGYQLTNTPDRISKIYFTHDIDVPFIKYSFKNMIKTIGKEMIQEKRVIIHPLLNWVGIYRVNPQNTWNYMLQKEKELKKMKQTDICSICFIVATKKADLYTMTYIEDRKFHYILEEMINESALIGLHTSFDGALSQEKIEEEKNNLEKVYGKKVLMQRNHYLRQIHPADMTRYENVGITDDFTCGFSEISGFMLGTCHPVRFINPADGKVHNIVLHGLHVMDGTLSGKKPYQMGLSFDESKDYCKKIIEEVKKHNGEICFLWHNGMFEKKKENYLKELYDWVLGYCAESVC